MKKRYNWNVLFFAAITVAMFTASCEDKFDEPPAQEIDSATVLTIAELRELIPMADESNTTFTGHTFIGDTIIYGVLTTDAKSGNIYKKHYIQDGEQAVELRLDEASRLQAGDSVRVNLKGSSLGYYRMLFQIDGVKTQNIVLQASGRHIEPQTVTIDELSAADFNPRYQSKLVRIEGVQFLPSDTTKTYADAPNQMDENRTLFDKKGKFLLVRTSGFSSFAGTKVASGSGTITGIINNFLEDRQLVIRDLKDVQLDEERF